MKNKCCKIGSHECNVIIPNPPKQFGYTKQVCADKCIIPAIKALWKAGFKTFASCCGHGKIEGMINFMLKRKIKDNK